MGIKVWHKIMCIKGNPLSKVRVRGTWLNIAKLNVKLVDWNIHFNKPLGRMLGTGNEIYFWKDKWYEILVLKYIFP